MIASHPNKLKPVLYFTEQVIRKLYLLDTFLILYDIYARVRFIFVKFNAFLGEAVWGTLYTK